MQRTLDLDVLFVESRASNTSRPSSTVPVTSEVNSSNVDGPMPIATSSGTVLVLDLLVHVIMFLILKHKQLKLMMKVKMSLSQNILFPLLFLSWYAKDQLKEIGCFLVNGALKKKLVAVRSQEVICDHTLKANILVLLLLLTKCAKHMTTDNNKILIGTIQELVPVTSPRFNDQCSKILV